jgi:hypothetical protein
MKDVGTVCPIKCYLHEGTLNLSYGRIFFGHVHYLDIIYI